MSPRTPKAAWQQQLIDSVTDLDELLALLQLSSKVAEPKSCLSFGLRVSRDFVARMEPGNPRDPLLLQVLPVEKELISTPGYSTDPLNESAANKLPGLLHKYHGRVLLILTAGCAVNCRYCFRRHFPYQENRLSQNDLKNILYYLAQDPSISEVILSGGDPLILKDESLANIIQQLSEIPHLKYLRFHTRFPIMIPARITDALLDTLTQSRLQTAIVIHCNHPNEINASVRAALQKFATLPIQLLNQSVLLKDVNDNAATLIELSHKLYASGVLPYYLHLLDPVQGAAHFAVSKRRGNEIMQQLQEQLPGYLVPKFVKEIANAQHKVSIDRQITTASS